MMPLAHPFCCGDYTGISRSGIPIARRRRQLAEKARGDVAERAGPLAERDAAAKELHPIVPVSLVAGRLRPEA
jgi:hypothetical protein